MKNIHGIIKGVDETDFIDLLVVLLSPPADRFKVIKDLDDLVREVTTQGVRGVDIVGFNGIGVDGQGPESIHTVDCVWNLGPGVEVTFLVCVFVQFQPLRTGGDSEGRDVSVTSATTTDRLTEVIKLVVSLIRER